MVGVDFGTTFSGFAIFRVPDEQRSKNTRVWVPRGNANTQIIGNEDWEDRPHNMHSHKLPTVIAYPNGVRSSLHECKWGWSATKYDKSMKPVHRIKLALEATTPEVMRPEVPAGMKPVDIISDYLACLRQEMMRFIESRYPVDVNLSADDLLICMTVPVGWSSQAHHTIRRAATNAGLISNENSRHLLFCYEPEAAALACVHESRFPISDSPMVLIVDCGGGTVDLFLARLDKNGDLEELTLGTGNFAGATSVDAQFKMFLRRKLGIRGYNDFKDKLPSRFTVLEQEWEAQKRTFSGTQEWLLRLPAQLMKWLPDDKQKEFEDLEILVTAADMKSFFDPVVDEIIGLICGQLRQARHLGGTNGIEKVKYLYLVGGFGSNWYLRDRIKVNSDVLKMVGNVVSLQRPEAAVVRGAVWFCINNQSIRMRRARQTIGIGVQREFDPRRDQQTEITSYDPVNPSRAFVPKAVLCFMSKGQLVSYNASFTRTGFRVLRNTQAPVKVLVYVSDLVPPAAKGRVANVAHPNRLDVSDCTLLGAITIELPNSTLGSDHTTVSIEICHGRVELSVRIIDETTGDEWTQFLNHGSFRVQSNLPASAA
ncbi:hypothetical protein GGF31_007020 [Allomyces arbusculus]|nr:hypothetical protein GGF31_007020 [Allomyces arbusculus]